MGTSRRDFLAATATAAAFTRNLQTEFDITELDGLKIARRHKIVRNAPTPSFFEGMLLGNGDIGVCVTVRPDAIGFHIGKSDSWDIRASEEHASRVLTFPDLLKLWERASAEAKREGHPDMLYLENKIPEFRAYTEMVGASYRKIWPRPWPCGIVWVHWDASRFRVVEQSLDPANGLFELLLMAGSEPVTIRAFVNQTAGHILVWSDRATDFSSVAYYPNVDSEALLPDPEVDATPSAIAATFSAFQRFPATAPTEAEPHPGPSPNDRSFALHAVVAGNWKRVEPSTLGIELAAAKRQILRIDMALITPRDNPANVEHARSEADRLSRMSPAEIQSESDRYWADFWSKSAVELKDQELERWWYHNQYWLTCCLRDGKIAPGLFGNWTSGKIGTAWHGDYHMNYNTQQVFWGVFSSNHVEQHLPYIDLVETLLPVSEKYAREKFGLPGAYFPHSAYPVPSQVVAYPVPPWGYEICETPWVVQSLWWHYLYTRDEQVLRRVYPLLKSAADFVCAYVKKGDDGKYHVRPTVSPKNWGCTVDYRLNQDCIMDLALIDFLLEAVVAGAEQLKVDDAQRERWKKIRGDLAGYPSAQAPDGRVWIDVLNAPVGWVYNIPVTLAPVFPGERVGIGSDENDLNLARHTAETIRLEGGNDIVYQPLIRARLGILDLEWFKREVCYCILPNGVINDRVRQIGGRYKDSTNFDFMMYMGVWTENFSLPVVLNECLLQSYSGVLRVFPNTMNLGPARFHKLRAAGAFLVSAAWDGKTVSPVHIASERGGNLRMQVPWASGEVEAIRLRGNVNMHVTRQGAELSFETQTGEEYWVRRA
jgi:alpha-L-fucosidase 2